ncbi:MAG: type VII secretion integral membrane protein EccD [Dactylosporangium sp.]|nr:type VII secretion integral membrane protein EccD [Dactylosporangium sp.]NNJ59823.1 type VII secretion integral membrane protein EccD [Dactylosporangium sp.]
MSTAFATGLARITVATPDRRIDLALPTNVALAGLLPSLLRHAGDGFADDGEQHGGWALRRGDGAELTTAETLSAHHVRDGELLHLVPRHAEWPEADCDDVVHSIAAGARRYGQPWEPATTRRATALVAAAFLGLALAVLLTSGPAWVLPGGTALGLSALLVVAGIVLSRALADSLTGVVVAALGLPFALAGGALVVAGAVPLTRLGAPSVLLGSVLLIGTSLLGYAGVADRARVFSGGIVLGLAGVLGSGLALAGMAPLPAVGVVLTVVVLLTPLVPLLAIRLGRIPVPALPEDAGAVLDDQPTVPAPAVFASVARADEILTGALLGGAVAGGVCLLVLGTVGGLAVPLLTGVCALAFLLRTRLFLAPRQRVPLLVAGLIGVGTMAMRLALELEPALRGSLVVVGLAAVGGTVIAGGLVYSRRSPSPYLGRFLELLDALVLMSAIPIACAATGVFQAARGYFG